MVDSQELFEWIGKADKLWHLTQAPLLKGIPEETLLKVSSLLKDEVFRRGEIIYDQGDKANSLYFLNRGSVRLSMFNQDDREKTFKILRGGEIFGLESMEANGDFQLRAIAHDESWISILTRDQFRMIATDQPCFYVNLVEILLDRLKDARHEVQALTFMDMQERLARALLKLAENHGKRVARQENMVRVRIRLSHDYLAGLIGSNRPYLSNIMSGFRKRGWVGYGNHYLLVNVKALEALLHRSVRV